MNWSVTVSSGSVLKQRGVALNPCFLFRPDIFLRACWRKVRARPKRCRVQTAWGDWLDIEPRKFIGRSIYLRGVHELAVCEVLWRLAAPGETALDVGANIGVMTSLLSKRVGLPGRVLAFEAHPVLFGQLERNVCGWPGRHIELFNRAVSRKAGVVKLCEGPAFEVNEGTARVAVGNGTGRCHAVPAITLDAVIPPGLSGVMKIDVEGHEADVLAGAAASLAEQRVRDIVFESCWNYPGAAHEALLAQGYRIFEVAQSVRGPKLSVVRRRWGCPERLGDYLATTDAPRALRLFAPREWQVLRRSRRHVDRTKADTAGASPHPVASFLFL